jgi:hypothetical protein
MFRASYRSLQTVANDAIFSQANVVTERLSGKKVVVTGPAETAAGRIDWAAWLRSQSRRQRTIASVLAGNHPSRCPEVPPQPRLNHPSWVGNLLAQLANSIAAVPSGSSESTSARPLLKPRSFVEATGIARNGTLSLLSARSNVNE